MYDSVRKKVYTKEMKRRIKLGKYSSRGLHALVEIIIEQLFTNSIRLGNLLDNGSMFLRGLGFTGRDRLPTGRGSTVITRRPVSRLFNRLIRISAGRRLVARGDRRVRAARMFVELNELIGVNDLRGRNSDCANYFIFWGLFCFLFPDSLTLRRINGFGSEDVTTRFRVSDKTNRRFTLRRVSSCGWCIINDDGRSALSTNYGSCPYPCSSGTFGGITGVLGIIRSRDISQLA
jgi:hypothetical protein